MGDGFDPYHKWLGIPPRDQPPHHYRLLGVQVFESDLVVIQNAADQRMAHLRSFQLGAYADWSQRLLNEVAAARVTLLNPEKKRAYDAHLAPLLAASPPAHASSLPPRSPSLPVTLPPPLPPIVTAPRRVSAQASEENAWDGLPQGQVVAARSPADRASPARRREAKWVTVRPWHLLFILAVVLVCVYTLATLIERRDNALPVSRATRVSQSPKRPSPPEPVAASPAPVAVPQDVRRQWIAVFRIHEGNVTGPPMPGVNVELLLRQERDGKTVVLGQAATDAAGCARISAWLDSEQRSRGGFLVTVRSPMATKTWPVPRFASATVMDLFLPVAAAPAAEEVAEISRAESEQFSEDRGEAAVPQTITLPSGRCAFSTRVMEKPFYWEQRFGSGGGGDGDQISNGVCQIDDKDLTAVVRYDDEGRVHGQAAVIGGDQLMLTNYHEGQRHGELQVWGHGWTPVLYANYQAGAKSGVLCLYRNSSPWLIGEWDSGALRQAYVYEDRELKAIAAGHVSLASLAAVEERIEEHETQVRLNLREQYRSQIESRRQQLAAKLSAEKRQRMTSRIQQRSAENAARTVNSFKSALRRGGF